MQLKPMTGKRTGHFRESLAAFSATLLAATLATHGAEAQDSSSSNENNNFGPGTAYTQIDGALLVYKEAGGRVQAIEPALDTQIHSADGYVLNVELIADAVSGATPNGAVPSDLSQTFTTPVRVTANSATGAGGEGEGEGGGTGAGTGTGGTTTVTGASGGSTVVSSGGTASRQYTVAPNTLPVDKGFRDRRYAANVNWSQPLGDLTLVGFGAGFSREHDYRSITANVRAAQNFDSNNTTVSLSLNMELDSSFPFGGIPTPLTAMDGAWKTPKERSKTQTGFVIGLTQVMTRRWLTEIDYAFNMQHGYENDPYRIISVVAPSTGEPTSYLYENRPNNRQTQSLFWDNKIDLDPTVTDVSFRFFTDNWGIKSETVAVSERLNVGSSFYVEPDVRWYHQTAASFYRYYLVAGQPLPAYVSSDTRLGAFTSLTYGTKVGFYLSDRTELYLRVAYYQQTGNGHPAGTFGQLRNQDLFAGTKAFFAFVGYTWDFH
ncbi:MAG: DUF3570 domain-containing protein [Alphaproteobacteria bacterium]|nr:DUF3570 domain-containing protein [Alphaproteobacteria bacterium]